jgi:hypothetical protein
MKRRISLLLLLCMVFAAMSALAVGEYLGSMEVVNCNEWVSLRETPSTLAKRLVKVSRGAIVSNCQQVDDEWIYAEYDGYSGYILAEYLQPAVVFSAMLITITGEGAPFYATLDAEEPIDVIPTNTIVRNCCHMDNDRIYVEWGGRCGFISLLHAEVYNEMLHFPQQIILHSNLYAGKYEGPALTLKADYTEDFPLAEFDYSEYDACEYEPVDAAIPKLKFVLHSDETVNHVHLFSISLCSWDSETGEAIYDATLENIQYQVAPQHPLSVTAVIWGDTPNLAVGYEDAQGVYHFAFVEISGEDGSLLLREF